MMAPATNFALIGQSFPSETFEGLHSAYVGARAERRLGRRNRAPRIWSAARDAIVLPKRLSA